MRFARAWNAKGDDGRWWRSQEGGGERCARAKEGRKREEAEGRADARRRFYVSYASVCFARVY